MTLYACFHIIILSNTIFTTPSSRSANLRGGSTYKREIVSAIVELKEPRGSSSVSIKELVQDNLPADKSFHNASFMRALKKAVDDGDVVKSANNSYKLSIGLRRNLKEAAAETYKTKPEPEAYKGLRADGLAGTGKGRKLQ